MNFFIFYSQLLDGWFKIKIQMSFVVVNNKKCIWNVYDNARWTDIRINFDDEIELFFIIFLNYENFMRKNNCQILWNFLKFSSCFSAYLIRRRRWKKYFNCWYYTEINTLISCESCVYIFEMKIIFIMNINFLFGIWRHVKCDWMMSFFCSSIEVFLI